MQPLQTHPYCWDTTGLTINGVNFIGFTSATSSQLFVVDPNSTGFFDYGSGQQHQFHGGFG